MGKTPELEIPYEVAVELVKYHLIAARIRLGDSLQQAVAHVEGLGEIPTVELERIFKEIADRRDASVKTDSDSYASPEGIFTRCPPYACTIGGIRRGEALVTSTSHRVPEVVDGKHVVRLNYASAVHIAKMQLIQSKIREGVNTDDAYAWWDSLDHDGDDVKALLNVTIDAFHVTYNGEAAVCEIVEGPNDSDVNVHFSDQKVCS